MPHTHETKNENHTEMISEEIKQAILYYVANGNTEEKKYLATQFSNYPYKILVNLCQIKTIDHFCHTNEYFLELINKKLAESNLIDLSMTNPKLALKSMDGSKVYSVFDLYLAAFYMNEFYALGRRTSQMRGGLNQLSKHRSEDLRHACQLGLYNAFLARFKVDDKIIHDEMHKFTQQAKDDALKELLNDADQLSNLYWGIGCASAGCELFAIGEFLLQQNDSESKARGKLIICAAIKKMLLAARLTSNDYSNSIMYSITHDKNRGLNAIFSNTTEIDWNNIQEELEKKFNEYQLGDENTTFAVLQKEVENSSVHDKNFMWATSK